MNPARVLVSSTLALALLAWSGEAPAQWAWRDAAGRMVYSDQPPPKSVPGKDIVRQPAAVTPRAVEPSPEEAVQGAPPAAPREVAPKPPTTAEREMQAKLKQQQLAEAQKKATDAEARQAKIAENCERLRAYQRALEGGFRIAKVNAAGQQEFIDDATRTAERERTRTEIEQQCQ